MAAAAAATEMAPVTQRASDGEKAETTCGQPCRDLRGELNGPTAWKCSPAELCCCRPNLVRTEHGLKSVAAVSPGGRPGHLRWAGESAWPSHCISRHRLICGPVDGQSSARFNRVGGLLLSGVPTHARHRAGGTLSESLTWLCAGGERQLSVKNNPHNKDAIDARCQCPNAPTTNRRADGGEPNGGRPASISAASVSRGPAAAAVVARPTRALATWQPPAAHAGDRRAEAIGGGDPAAPAREVS